MWTVNKSVVELEFRGEVTTNPVGSFTFTVRLTLADMRIAALWMEVFCFTQRRTLEMIKVGH